MPDPELVEHVCVVNRDVGDDEVGAHQKPEHVLPDVALLHDFGGGVAADPDLSKRRLNELFVNRVEIDSCLGAERPDDECTGHGVATCLPFGRMLACILTCLRQSAYFTCVMASALLDGV